MYTVFILLCPASTLSLSSLAEDTMYLEVSLILWNDLTNTLSAGWFSPPQPQKWTSCYSRSQIPDPCFVMCLFKSGFLSLSTIEILGKSVSVVSYTPWNLPLLHMWRTKIFPDVDKYFLWDRSAWVENYSFSSKYLGGMRHNKCINLLSMYDHSLVIFVIQSGGT